MSADEFQFLIVETSGAALDVGVGELSDLLEPFDESPDWLIVHTGAHWGPVHVAVASHPVEPAVGDEWDEVVEVSVKCSVGLRVSELDGTPGPVLVDRGGRYRLRLSVSGRAAGYERYSSGERTKVLETYLFEVWPAPPAPARVLRAVDPVERVAPVVEHEAAGRAAAARVDNDINAGHGARALCGATGTVTASYTYLATARKLFPQFAMLDMWLGHGGSGGEPSRDEAGVHGLYICYGSVLGGTSGGCIWGEFVDFEKPKFVTSTWNWRRRPSSTPPVSWDKREPVLPVPATLRIDFTQRRADSVTSTQVAITHSGLPIEWCPDITAFWNWKLESGHKDYDLGHY